MSLRVTTRGGMTGALCECGRWSGFGVYGIAQMAMGHGVSHTCECGKTINAERAGRDHYRVSYAPEPRKEARTKRATPSQHQR